MNITKGPLQYLSPYQSRCDQFGDSVYYHYHGLKGIGIEREGDIILTGCWQKQDCARNTDAVFFIIWNFSTQEIVQFATNPENAIKYFQNAIAPKPVVVIKPNPFLDNPF